ncbi:hypothetical protein HK097_005321 [Rhizophlyctis rosea]|uniref:RZ-type domain-containing protein n=1 Tax=Rhizophlyctis rosea TaxID=64517 RepID=A0AAD5SJ80_9FUNG|nr:hypothetical protein HK097_005321 [Rhizophlyctis rosea]
MCPSICGEPCPQSMFCHICAPPKVKNAVVDMIMMTTFEECDPDEAPFIVLACGHAFTFETLDGIMEMAKYYETSLEGSYTRCKQLPSEMWAKAPQCPNCRAPIKVTDVRRYGRPLNKAVLDVTTKKFISKWNARLIAVRKLSGPALVEVSKKKEGLKFGIGYEESSSKREGNERPQKAAARHHLKQLFEQCGISDEDQVMWVTFTAPLEKVHREYSKIQLGCAKSPTKAVYEASVASVERLAKEDELQRGFVGMNIGCGSGSGSIGQPAHPIRETVAMPIPRLDGRLTVESSLGVVEVDLSLFKGISETVMPAAPKAGENALSPRAAWASAAIRILDRSEAGILKLVTLCGEMNLNRKEADLQLLLGNIMCRRLSFCFAHSTDVAGYVMRSGVVIPQLAGRELRIAFAEGVNADVRQRLRAAEGVVPDGYRAVFEKGMNELLATLEEYMKKARLDTFYQAVDQAEKLEIIRAMQSEFHGSGHWYQCPNGHTYTIGECGGAMQSSQCPECGATVGGGGHQLATSNRRDDEFERLIGGR